MAQETSLQFQFCCFSVDPAPPVPKLKQPAPVQRKPSPKPLVTIYVYFYIGKLQNPQGDMSQVKKKRKQLIVKTKEKNQQQQLKVCQRVCESTRLSKKAFVASLKLPVESMSKLLGGREFQSLIVLVQKLNL